LILTQARLVLLLLLLLLLLDLLLLGPKSIVALVGTLDSRLCSR